MEDNQLTIDAVITWVDGNDTVWQEKINSYRDLKIDFTSKEQMVRFNSIGEIDIAITSIIKFAPFVRNIFLVTDNQKPDSFDELVIEAQKQNINLILIDHKTIFRDFEEFLPCFNSCSIGNMLFRIPDLSEHFIIFNDDTFLMREATPKDFFINGKPIIRGKWEKFHEDRSLRKLYHKALYFVGKKPNINRTSFKTFQQRSAKLAGTSMYIRRFHTPVCVRKSTLENFFKNNETLLSKNIQFRFRDRGQFIISSLSEHLEIQQGTYHFSRDTHLTYFRSYKKPNAVKKKLANFIKDKSKIFMTFQSLEKAEPELLNYITNWISKRLSK